MRKFTISVFLIFLSIGFGLVVGEIAVRLFFPSAAESIRLYDYMERLQGKFTRFDPEVGWTGIPNVEGTHLWPDSKSRVHQNAYGFRGTEHPHQRTDRRRIVCLGDSFVWGFGADEDFLFTRVIEKMATTPVEIVNLGVSGYGNDQMFLQWRQIGHKWNPDEVWLFITYVTDLIENVRTKVYEYSKPVFKENSEGQLELIPVSTHNVESTPSNSRIKVDDRKPHLFSHILKYSDLACLVTKSLLGYEAVRQYLEQRKIIPKQHHGYEWEYGVYRVPVSSGMARKWHHMDKIIQMLADDVSRRGIRLRIVLIPSVVQVYPNLWQRFMQQRPSGEPINYYPALPNRIISDMTSVKGATLIDLLPGMLDAGRTNPELYFPFNRHWTRDGHRKVAEILVTALNHP